MARLLEPVKGNLGVMILSSGIWMLAGQLVYPFRSLYILHLGGSYFHIGLISAIGAITGIVRACILCLLYLKIFLYRRDFDKY
jgi:hypothetical protein